MANSKKFEASKRDMNFFSAFSSASGQIGSYMSLTLIVVLAFLIVGGGVYAFVFLQTRAIQSNIDILNAKMESEAYQSELAKFSEVNISMSVLNQQYYEVSALYSRVQNTDKIESSYMDTIYSSVPSDVIITDFAYTDGTVILSGTADSYYSPLDMIANFSKSKLFTNVEITNIAQVDNSAQVMTPEALAAAKDYTFTLQGSLKSTYAVLISRLIDDVATTPLTAVKSQTLGVGEQFAETGVNTFTSPDGTTYILSRISIDDVFISEADLSEIKLSDSISGIVSSSVDIKLYYTLSVTTGGVQE